jgi:DNA-binding winged helix-turn-helix (wHTH) protein
MSNSRPFQLRDWRIEPALHRITGEAGTHQVEPRVMDVLVCLASRPGEVFSRDELLQAVWRDVVVSEEALTRAISELRRVLDDDPKSPRYVETIRKGGYRLVAQVERAEDRPSESVEGAAESAASGASRVYRLVAAIALLASAAVFAIWYFGYRGSTPEPGSEALVLVATPLTSLEGPEEFPAISRDGTYVAFAWAGEAQDNVDIYVKQVGTEARLRLTDHPGVDTYPRWSVDGKTLAFLHIDESGQALYTVPLIGGQPRRLIAAGAWIGGHDWSPDGHSLVYSEAASPSAPARLFLLDLDTMETRSLTPQSEDGIDVGPVFSPDGRTVAFMRANAAQLFDVFLADVESGEVRRLTQGLLQTRGIDWTRDGRSLICSAVSSAYYTLLRIDVAGACSVTRTRRWDSPPSR